VSQKYWILIVTAPFFIVFDQLTKLVVLDRFYLGESISVISGYFNLTYIQNTGAAFGFMADAHPAIRVPFFLAVPAIALVAMGYVYKGIPDRDKWMSFALSLVIGGAIGNLIDRARLGFVVDFLDFHWQGGSHFPAFNVADSAICVGVGMLMLDLLRNKGNDASTSV
jgi:signal peptidase II